jgi:hypothetical protein
MAEHITTPIERLRIMGAAVIGYEKVVPTLKGEPLDLDGGTAIEYRWRLADGRLIAGVAVLADPDDEGQIEFGREMAASAVLNSIDG